MPKFKLLPSQEELHHLFDYSVVTGALYWKNPPRYKAWKGKEAGSYRGAYISVYINGDRYYAHRVIYKWVTGVDPEELQIDHRNEDKLCNGWHNLRLADNSQNKFNRKKVRGCSWNAKKKHWVVTTNIKGKRHYIGVFKTEEEAQEAYKAASLRLHGEYSGFRDHYR